MIKVGPYSVSTFIFGTFRLDGGAMFGSVPRNLWEKKIAPDSENCIPLAARSLIIEGNGRKILVDVGLGDKWDEKRARIFDIKNTAKENFPFRAEEVTDIILTHLHFDHAGGVSSFNANGDPVLVYPQATHYVQKSNLENAKKPTLKERASYLNENIYPLTNTAELVQLEGDTDVFDNISVRVINGHTVGQQWVKITGDDKVLVFPTDLIPTSHHLSLPFTMGYDMCATTVLEEKEHFLTEAVSENWIVVFEHDPVIAAATVKRDSKGSFVIKDVIDL